MALRPSLSQRFALIVVFFSCDLAPLWRDSLWHHWALHVYLMVVSKRPARCGHAARGARIQAAARLVARRQRDLQIVRRAQPGEALSRGFVLGQRLVCDIV